MATKHNKFYIHLTQLVGCQSISFLTCGKGQTFSFLKKYIILANLVFELSKCVKLTLLLVYCLNWLTLLSKKKKKKLTNVNMTHTRTKITKHNCNQLRERISWLNCCVTEFSGLAFDLIIWLQRQLQLFWLCTTKIWYFFRIVDTNTLRGCLGLNALDQTIYNVL